MPIGCLRAWKSHYWVERSDCWRIVDYGARYDVTQCSLMTFIFAWSFGWLIFKTTIFLEHVRIQEPFKIWFFLISTDSYDVDNIIDAARCCHVGHELSTRYGLLGSHQRKLLLTRNDLWMLAILRDVQRNRLLAMWVDWTWRIWHVLCSIDRSNTRQKLFKFLFNFIQIFTFHKSWYRE